MLIFCHNTGKIAKLKKEVLNFELGENALWAFPNILVNSEKLDINAPLNQDFYYWLI